MKKINEYSSKDFHKLMLEKGFYETPNSNKKIHLPSFMATLIFNICMGEIFVTGHFSAKRKDFMDNHWADFGLRVYRLVERLGGKIRIEGFEKMKDIDTPVVWVCNHMSSLETYMLPSILMSWPGLVIVLKKSLLRYPFFGQVVRAVNPIPLLRENPIDDLRAVLKDGVEEINKGRSALIFPQGTRYRKFNPKTLNTLGTKLAIKAKKPVVPIAISMDFLRIGEWQRDLFAKVNTSSPVLIACGDPISPDLPPNEIQKRTTDFIVNKLKEWEKETGLELLDLT